MTGETTLTATDNGPALIYLAVRYPDWHPPLNHDHALRPALLTALGIATRIVTLHGLRAITTDAITAAARRSDTTAAGRNSDHLLAATVALESLEQVLDLMIQTIWGPGPTAKAPAGPCPAYLDDKGGPIPCDMTRAGHGAVMCGDDPDDQMPFDHKNTARGAAWNDDHTTTGTAKP